MRKSKAKKGFSWIRLILMLAALIVLGLVMYYLQKTADLSEEQNGVQRQETTQRLTNNGTENTENKPRVRSVSTKRGSEVATRRAEEQVLNSSEEVNEKILMKRREAEIAREGGQRPQSLIDADQKLRESSGSNAQVARVGQRSQALIDAEQKQKRELQAKAVKEEGERPQSLIDADQKTRTKKNNDPKANPTNREKPKGEAARSLLIILEMFQKKNAILVKKDKAPRTFLLGVADQTNELIATTNKASSNGICGAIKTDALKLQESIESNREQLQFYGKEIKKLSNVFAIYCE